MTARKRDAVSILCALLPYALFAALGDWGRGRTAGICCAMGIFAGRSFWHRRRHAWFWAVLAVMILLHVALVLAIPWTDKSYPGYTLLPEAALDYGIFYGSFSLAEKAIGRGRRASSQG